MYCKLWCLGIVYYCAGFYTEWKICCWDRQEKNGTIGRDWTCNLANVLQCSKQLDYCNSTMCYCTDPVGTNLLHSVGMRCVHVHWESSLGVIFVVFLVRHVQYYKKTAKMQGMFTTLRRLLRCMCAWWKTELTLMHQFWWLTLRSVVGQCLNTWLSQS